MNDNYVYEILKISTGYCFRLLPNNSRTQPVGLSVAYRSLDDCRDALCAFKRLIADDVNGGNEKNHVKIKRDENRKFYFVFYDDGNNIVFYRDKHYQKKTNCCNGIRRVIENFDADLKFT